MSLTLTRRHNADRFGYLIPHRYGNLPMVGAVATYRPGEGRFGRGAVVVEEGTENLLRGVNWTGRTVLDTTHWHSALTINHDDDYPYVSYGYAWNFTTRDFTLSEGTYTLSMMVKSDEGRPTTANTRIVFNGFYDDTVDVFLAKPNTEWQRVSYTFTLESERMGFLRFLINGGQDKIRFANIQIEKKPFATSFVDGSRGNGVLSYNINTPPQCTISFWFKLDNQTRGWTGDSIPFLLYFSDGDGYINWRRRGGTSYSDSFSFSLEESGGGELHVPRSSTSGEWNHICYVFDGTNFTFYYNGDRRGTATITKPASFGELRWKNDSGSYLFDELLILPYAASEEEIVSWYEAQGPLPPHPQAALQWDWQAVRPAQIVKL